MAISIAKTIWSFFRRFLHWGPATAIAIIKIITVMTLYMNSMWWPPNKSMSGYINHKLFIFWSTMTAINFVMAAVVGPKHVPLKWRPKKPKQEQCLQYCKVCEGFKAPRSHHCRKCDRCVMRMDHHCPWINNCVGWGNQAFFVYFLGCAVIGCGHATFILLGSLIRGLNRYQYLYHGQYHLATVEFTQLSLVLCILSLGLAIGVVIAVGMLLVFQVLAVCRNRTGIEDWILEKAKYRREGTGETFVFPYHLGVWPNIRQVFPAPFSCAPVGDGLWWTVNAASDQFTLTLEQLAQKDEKRQRTKTYTIVRRATGSWCPIWSQGWRVGCQPPFTDEARIRLEGGDVVHVTRWKKHWLFGEVDEGRRRMNNGGGGEERKKQTLVLKGWFPRKCAIELVENDNEDRQYLNKHNSQHRQQNHHHHHQQQQGGQTGKERKKK